MLIRLSRKTLSPTFLAVNTDRPPVRSGPSTPGSAGWALSIVPKAVSYLGRDLINANKS